MLDFRTYDTNMVSLTDFVTTVKNPGSQYSTIYRSENFRFPDVVISNWIQDVAFGTSVMVLCKFRGGNCRHRFIYLCKTTQGKYLAIGPDGLANIPYNIIEKEFRTMAKVIDVTVKISNRTNSTENMSE